MKRLAPVLVAMGLAACSAPQDTVVGKPPTDDVAAASGGKTLQQPEGPAAQARPVYPDPKLSLATWPFAENTNTFVLTWDGGNRPVPLHRDPDPNSELLGEATWEPGERIRWVATVLSVYQPRVLRANSEWFTEGPIHSDGYMTEQAHVEWAVKKGERVEVWAYGGDGLCYMAHKQDIFTAPCPPKDSFTGLGAGQVPAQWYGPESRVWWVQIAVGTLSAWFPVDDRFIVDIVDN